MVFFKHITSLSISRFSAASAYVRTKGPAARSRTGVAFFSSDDNITYSGGQKTEGQGGYYGSGGSRKLDESSTQKLVSSTDPRPQMCALAADVTNITNTMKEVENLELILHEIEESGTDEVDISDKSIGVKNKIKKACTNPEFIDSLNRLWLGGEPIWGLSGDEREMIVSARSKVNGL